MARFLFAALALLITTGASAAAADQKIGYVDMAKALNEVDDGKAAKKKLKSEFDARQTKLDKLQNELKTKKDDFEKKSAMMKPDVKAQKAEELQRSFVELQQTYMQLQQELLAEENKLMADIGQKLRSVVTKIGSRDGYDMIVDIGDTVLYYKPHQDITEDVVKAYNQQYAKK